MKIILGLLLFFFSLHLQGFAADKPNVIIIFIDDMGYGDVGFNGAKGPKTPELDRMGKEGMIFDDFYVGCAVCSGSRTALMTGTHYQRLSMNAVLFPQSSHGLHPDEMTIAEMLKGVGYKTACVGKWHLGHLPPCLPTYQGFDSYYGIPYSNDMWIDPASKLSKDLVVREGLTRAQVEAGHKKRNWVPLIRGEEVIEYPANQKTLTKRYTEESVKFIKENKDGPFFLYLPHTMVHLPLAVSKEFEGRTGKLIWDAIEEVDWSVGQILKTVKELKIADNTLVVFTSDNGPEKTWTKRAELHKHQSNGIYREGKRSIYEGGHRVPFFIRWPAKVEAGSTWDEPVCQTDLLATFAEMVGAKLPPDAGEDSDSFYMDLLGRKRGIARLPMIHHSSNGRFAIRDGQWKLVMPHAKSRVELYDLSTDPSEKKDLAKAHPEIVNRLTESITRVVLLGRSTPGPKQSNDTPAWPDLAWMKSASKPKR